METVERDVVALVREYRRAVEERDLERLSSLVHPDFELEPLRKDRTLTIADLREQWSCAGGDGGFDHLDVEVRPGEPREVDGRVVVEDEQILRWKDGGDVASTLRRGLVFSLENGRIRRVQAFARREEPSAAVEGRA